MSQNKNQENPFNIEISEELAAGVYSNFTIVMPAASEIVLDFIQMHPSMESAKVRSRVIMTPDNFKRLVRLLNDNLNAYERDLGIIPLLEDRQERNI